MSTSNIVALTFDEISEISGGNDCTQGVAGVAAATAAVIALAAAPLTFGVSLVLAAAAGFAGGVAAGEAVEACK